MRFWERKKKKNTSPSPQGMTFPQRAASLHCDAWPLPLGPQLALQQSSRGRQKRKGVGHGSRGKREQKNRTKNSICSGLDGSFFSLESSALNPICASCQLCPVSLVGTKKKTANGWQAYSAWGQDMANPCWNGLFSFPNPNKHLVN